MSRHQWVRWNRCRVLTDTNVRSVRHVFASCNIIYYGVPLKLTLLVEPMIYFKHDIFVGWSSTYSGLDQCLEQRWEVDFSS